MFPAVVPANAGTPGVRDKGISHTAKDAIPRRMGPGVRRDDDVVVQTPKRYATASKHHARMPFCACRRFSAASNATDCGPAITSSVTSSPRWAGRQCMNSASGFANAISLALTWYGFNRLWRCSPSLSPIENQVSVTTQSAPRTAASGSLPSTIGAWVALIQSFIDLLGASSGGVATLRLIETAPRHAPMTPARCCRRRSRRGAALDRAAMLLERHQVRHHLAGMRAPRKPVDDGHGCVRGKLQQRIMVCL